MGNQYKPTVGVSTDRVLVAIVFTGSGEQMVADQAKWIRFPGAAFLGEAQHPDGVIVKTNEPGAYGIGRNALRGLNGCISETRLANPREVAKALGKPTAHVQPRMRLQRW